MKPLNEPITSVPHFMPNQVLTHTQLNAVVDYLDQQERFTRQRLIGIGIVCGFETSLVVNAGNSRAVDITKGVGISSCGFLFNIPEDIRCDRYRLITISDYDTFNRGTPGTPLDCIELIDDDAVLSDEELEDINNLTSAQTANKIVVLYLDLKDQSNGTCLGDNCDEKGNSYVFTLRKLLIDKPTMNLIIRYAHGLAPADVFNEFFYPQFYLPETYVERFGASAADPDQDFTLASIFNLASFEDEYKSVTRSAALRTAQCIAEAYRLFGPLFNPQMDNVAGTLGGFNNTTQAANSLVIRINDYLNTAGTKYKVGNTQYVYDYIRDIADTYNELREELFKLIAECSPPNDVFPRHLMLGELQTRVLGRFNRSDYDLPTVYRHYFIPSPVMNAQTYHYKKVIQLMKRLLMMCDTNNYLSFSNILTSNINNEPIRTIPGKTCSEPLGKRNVPFYYDPLKTPLIHEYWDFDRVVTNMPYRNRGYFSGSYNFSSQPTPNFHSTIDRATEFRNDPVLFDLCKYPKLGIEGHVGKTLGEAIDKLKDLRKRYNLSFDIIALKFDAKNKMVALADENLIAELQLMYLHERNDFVCCVEELEAYIRKSKNIIILGFYFAFLSIVDPNNPPDPAVVTYLFDILEYIIDAYADALGILVEAMPPDIKEFDFEKMFNIFPVVSSFTGIFKYFINTWGDIELALYKDNKDGFNGQAFLADFASILLNLWESYLDKIGDDCVLGKFATIWKSYQERIQTFCVFSEFNEQIHGMEHISGTSNGGTFILVYDDFDPVNVYEMEVMDEFGHMVSDAEIYGDYTGNYYGKTNHAGKFSGKVSKEDKAFYVNKTGYVATTMKRKAMDKGEATIGKYETYLKEDNWRDVSSPDPVDAVYLKMGGAMEELYQNFGKQRGVPKAMVKDFKPKAAALSGFTINNDHAGFRVVADFYLPHLVHNYNITVEPFDACARLGETKLFDFDAISKFLGQKMKTTSKAMNKKGYTGPNV
jgi:hypothetical protein